MKKTITLLFSMICLLHVSVEAQEKSKWKELDKSAMDMEYYPANVAWRNYLSGEERTKNPKIKLTYARPSKNDRAIFGELIPYGKEWRLGANEANEITFYQSVDVQGQSIPRGVYTVFATPNEDHWVISFSTERNIWGAANRDIEKTVASAKVVTTQPNEVMEQLSMTFQRVDEESVNLVIAWDNTQVTLPIGFNPIEFEDADVSPMDQIHFPNKSAFTNYLEGVEKENIKPLAKLTYSRPQKKGRTIFGELLKYGNTWRVGANQSTEITFYKNAKIDGQELRRGTYNIFAVVNQGNWEIIFNTDRPSWGAANRDEEQDVLKVTVPTHVNNEDLEVLNILFEEKTETSTDLIIAWETTMVTIPISFE